MKPWEVEQNTGCRVIVTGEGDLAMSNKYLIDEEVYIIKLTKSGLAYIKDMYGNFHSVPPRNLKFIEWEDDGNWIHDLDMGCRG